MFHRLQCLILHSIRLCQIMHIHMVFHMSIMRNTRFVVMASTERATALYPSVPPNCLERISRIQRLSYVILVVARASVQLRAESQLIRQWDLRHSKVSQWEPEVEILIQQSSNILRTKKERHSQRSSVCSTRSPVFMVSQESPVTSEI